MLCVKPSRNRNDLFISFEQTYFKIPPQNTFPNPKTVLKTQTNPKNSKQTKITPIRTNIQKEILHIFTANFLDAKKIQ